MGVTKKPKITSGLLLMASFVLLSWGRAGHQIIAGIAAAHLTPVAAQKVSAILGSETMVSVSTYADEIRPDSFFLFTGKWHYVDVPPNENAIQFAQSVQALKDTNLYRALLHWERVLGDSTANESIRNFALKMVIHLVGDGQQPMHVARSPDQGGNLIRVFFDGDTTNLHSVWDTRLISRTKRSVPELTSAWDSASAAQIKKWQSDALIDWLYESNVISNQLYDEKPRDQKLGDEYYRKHIGTVALRIDQAGIRLAGVLNRIFDPSHA